MANLKKKGRRATRVLQCVARGSAHEIARNLGASSELHGLEKQFCTIELTDLALSTSTDSNGNFAELSTYEGFPTRCVCVHGSANDTWPNNVNNASFCLRKLRVTY